MNILGLASSESYYISYPITFTLAHRDLTVEDWPQVIWFDECYVWLTGTRSRAKVIRHPGEDYEDEYLVLQFPKWYCILIWDDILGNKKARLILWEKEDWWNITASSYEEHIVTPVLWPFCRDESERLVDNLPIWVMKDSASAHQAQYTTAIRQRYRMSSLQWPPFSPNLNPIENLWRIRKERLNKRSRRSTGLSSIATTIQNA